MRSLGSLKTKATRSNAFTKESAWGFPGWVKAADIAPIVQKSRKTSATMQNSPDMSSMAVLQNIPYARRILRFIFLKCSQMNIWPLFYARDSSVIELIARLSRKRHWDCMDLGLQRIF